MIILGIDPGLQVAGYAVMQRDKQKTLLLDYGALKLSSSDSVPHRIFEFHRFFKEKITQFPITALALETPFLGKNAQNFLKLGYLRGILYLLAHEHGISLVEFAPREIKLSLTGYGAAEKEQVARVILRLFPGLVMPQRLDITDALAVALCGIWKEGNRINHMGVR